MGWYQEKSTVCLSRHYIPCFSESERTNLRNLRPSMLHHKRSFPPCWLFLGPQLRDGFQTATGPYGLTFTRAQFLA